MILYKTDADNTLVPIREKPFRLEREMQRLFEQNLEVIMGLELVKTECTIKNKRIDTLAFDPQIGAFVIIEYKRDRNMSVFDQGITYLNLLLQNKADFLVEYNERGMPPLARIPSVAAPPQSPPFSPAFPGFFHRVVESAAL